MLASVLLTQSQQGPLLHLWTCLKILMHGIMISGVVKGAADGARDLDMCSRQCSDDPDNSDSLHENCLLLPPEQGRSSS